MFGTNDQRGLEKMKDAMWGVDPLYGVRYRDPHDPSQMMLDIRKEPDTGPLLAILVQLLQDEARTVEELKDYTLTQTVYRPQQVHRLVLKQLRERRFQKRGRGHLSGSSVIELHNPSRLGDQPSLFDA
jgi:hypothetical protein